MTENDVEYLRAKIDLIKELHSIIDALNDTYTDLGCINDDMHNAAFMMLVKCINSVALDNMNNNAP